MWEDVWRSPQEARLGGGLLQAGGTHRPRWRESSGVCTGSRGTGQERKSQPDVHSDGRRSPRQQQSPDPEQAGREIPTGVTRTRETKLKTEDLVMGVGDRSQ